MTEGDPNSIEAAAAHTAKLWMDGGGIYFGELQKLAGLTLDQALLFELVCGLRDIRYENAAWRQRSNVAAATPRTPSLMELCVCQGFNHDPTCPARVQG